MTLLPSCGTLTDGCPRRREIAFLVDKQFRMVVLVLMCFFIVPHQDNRRPGSDCFAANGLVFDVFQPKTTLKKSSMFMHIDSSPVDLHRPIPTKSTTATDSSIEMSSPQSRPTSDISVMLYTAPWCRACKTVHRQLSKIAAKYPSIVFEQTSIEGDEDLESMGIAAVPHFKIIHDQKGVVESFSAGPTRSHIVEQKINKHIPKPRSDEYFDPDQGW